MKEAMNSLSNLIITLQGNGDYDGVKKLMEEKGSIGPELKKDLERLKESKIPVDVTFAQGVKVANIK
jgi:hypothetical protein